MSILSDPLAQADRHVVEAEQRITRQLERIEELARGGHDTAKAQALLRVFRKILDSLRAHRRVIFALLPAERDAPPAARPSWRS